MGGAGEPDGTERDRAVGTLLGLAAGDAVGTTLEFCSPGTFDPITDMVGGGPFQLQAGQWTDDTSMALCLAESIVDRGGHDPKDQLARYLHWRYHGHLSSTGRCFDIGNTTSSQLDRFRRSGEPYDPDPDQDAAANGSLMRLAPVPIRWHGDLEETVERAADSSRTTHGAQRPVDACKVHAAMTAAFIAGESWESVASPGFWRFGPLHPQVESVARGSWSHKDPPEIRGTGFCVDALEAAVWAVSGATDFREAVLRAANLGDDADTTAAIAGQLAGARWGASGIPDQWIEQLTMVGRIRSLALRLFAAGRQAPMDSPREWEHDAAIHAWWVPGTNVLAGEYPGNPDRARTTEKVNILVNAGVRTFVDLTTAEDHLDTYKGEVVEAANARSLDLQIIRHCIPDVSVTTDDHYDRIVADILAASERGAVYVHCWGGVGRTGTVVGALLADRGMAAPEIFGTIDGARGGTRKAHRRCPETDEQCEVIRRRSAGNGAPQA